MKGRLLRAEGLLLLASAIWGFAFVAQRAGMAHVGPFTFNAIRFALGALVLVPFFVRRESTPPPESVGRLSGAGLAAGVILFLGASLQQVGIVTTTAGKAGFITGLYVIFVPLLRLVAGRPLGASTWAGALLAVIGLYLLSGTGGAGIHRGDGLVLLSAIFFAFHVLLIGRIAGRAPATRLAAIQFAVCSVLSGVVALAREEIGIEAIGAAAIPILYGGILSVGVGYTLQVAGQRDAPPSHAAILLSFEAVFAVIGGRLLLGESLSARGITGCALMLAGILVSQWAFGGRAATEKGGGQ